MTEYFDALERRVPVVREAALMAALPGLRALSYLPESIATGKQWPPLLMAASW